MPASPCKIHWWLCVMGQVALTNRMDGGTAVLPHWIHQWVLHFCHLSAIKYGWPLRKKGPQITICLCYSLQAGKCDYRKSVHMTFCPDGRLSAWSRWGSLELAFRCIDPSTRWRDGLTFEVYDRPVEFTIHMSGLPCILSAMQVSPADNDNLLCTISAA